MPRRYLRAVNWHKCLVLRSGSMNIGGGLSVGLQASENFMWGDLKTHSVLISCEHNRIGQNDCPTIGMRQYPTNALN